MLTEISAHLDPAKFNDVSKRLLHTDTKTALAGEAELAVLWAISRVAHCVPEPTLPNSTRRPDLQSDDLFASGPAVIEVRALSDDSFSGKAAMDRTANIIAGHADQLRKRAGNHLYFEFMERNYWDKRRYHRERCVDPKFRLSPKTKHQLQLWITALDWPNPGSIRIADGKTDVVITWHDQVSPLHRTHCRMPPVAYHPEANPVYKALEEKSDQLKGSTQGTLRCVVLVDTGCSLLRRLRPFGVQEIGGETIIRHALAKLRIDIVIVLSPYRQHTLDLAYHSKLIWNVMCYDRRLGMPTEEYERITQMAKQLPRPQLEGYQARDMHRQGGFAPDNKNVWHLPTVLNSYAGGRMTIKVSAGLLHDYLAGRIDHEEFKKKAFWDDQDYFASALVQGLSIREARFEAGGMDKDDDYVVFDLNVDWDKIAKRKPALPPGGEVT